MFNTTNDKRSKSRTDSRFAQTRVSRRVWLLAETGVPPLPEDCVRNDVVGSLRKRELNGVQVTR